MFRDPGKTIRTWCVDRYGLFVFYQPNGIINYTALTTPIINWNYSSFIDTHSLGTPMYANWHVTLHSE